MGKLIIKELQLTGVKWASKLSTDENGNVVVGEDVGGVVDTSDEALAAQLIAQDDLFRKGVLKKIVIRVAGMYLNGRDSRVFMREEDKVLEGSIQVGDREYPAKLFTSFNYGRNAPAIYFRLNDIILKEGEEINANLRIKAKVDDDGNVIKSKIAFVQSYYYLDGYRFLRLIGEKPTVFGGDDMFRLTHDQESTPGVLGYLHLVHKNEHEGKSLEPILTPAPEKEMTLNVSYVNFAEGELKPIVSRIFFCEGRSGSNAGYAYKEIVRPAEGASKITSPAYKWREIKVAFDYEENLEYIKGGNFPLKIDKPVGAGNYQLELYMSGVNQKNNTSFVLNPKHYSENHINIIIEKMV